MVSLFLRKRNGTYILDKKEFGSRLRKLIGFKPGDLSIYEMAFIHRSASVRLPDGTKVNNERLEYLGDAVIDTILSEYLFTRYPDADEGILSKARARLVNREVLNQASHNLGIGNLLISQISSTHSPRHLYGNALEALIGAIFIDKGYRKTSKFVRNRMLRAYDNIDRLLEKDNDYKSLLIEWSQREKKAVVFNFSEEIDYKSKQSHFSATLDIDNIEIARGGGSSKKEAEQEASQKAWLIINNQIASINGK